MSTVDFSNLTPAQVADLRRKLESAGCAVPAHAAMLDQLTDAIAAFRKQQGMAAGGPLDEATWRRLDTQSGSVFSEVLQNELDLLRPRPDGSLDQVMPACSAELLRRSHGATLALSLIHI